MHGSTYRPNRSLAGFVIFAIALLCNAGCSLFGPSGPEGQVANWLVLKPLAIAREANKSPDEAVQQAAFARDWLESQGGEAGIQPRAGMGLTVDGRPLTWRRVASKNDIVDLQTGGHPIEYAVAYAYTEIEQPQAGKAFLGIGSDDAVKVWVNGRLVHENWAGRSVRLDDDLVPVELDAGKNRLLLKVQNGNGPWALACRVMSDDEGRAIQAYNQYIHAVAEGDTAAIRSFCHTTTDEEFQQIEAAAAYFESLARLRRGFDETYGPGQLMRLGFGYVRPDLRLPPRPSFQMEGNRASFKPPQWWEISLIKVDNAWREFVLPWPDAVSRAAARGVNLLPREKQSANKQAMIRAMDAVTDGVRAGRYLSAADAFGDLNARLHGLAGDLAANLIASTVDLTAPATQPAGCSVRIIEVRGDAAEIGKSYGLQARDQIRLLTGDYLNRILASYGSEFLRGMVREAVYAKSEQFKPFIRPEHLAEIRAAAASAGVGFREALLGQCFVDLASGPGCCTIALPAAASSDKVARFGRNMDFFGLGVLEKNSILLIVHPKDRYAFAAITWPGLVGVLSGMNEHGLTVACMEVPRPSRQPNAMPYMLLYRSVLEHCRTTEEAIAFLEKTPRQTAHNLMIMDAAGDRALAEIQPEKVTVRRAPETAALVGTNHQRGTDLDSPGRCKRFDYLHDAARRQFGQLSETAVEELLCGAAQGNMTLQSIVFEPANRVVYLAVGAGAPNHGFARIDLKPYFR